MGFRVIARPRIHMGLVDLGGVSARSFCGVGFSVLGPSTIWRIENSTEVSLAGISELDAAAVNDIKRIVDALTTLGAGGFTATLEAVPLQHIGLGTKTSLLLSLITGVNSLKGLNLSRSQIQRLSGRGGASGVGINLFFCGGFLWDGGHPVSTQLRFRPSSASNVVQTPPLLARWSFPDRWLVGLALPSTKKFYGTEELAFFESKTPISHD
jgi:beta-ribofuranosylaminobenzene 5'-phosphate synthase